VREFVNKLIQRPVTTSDALSVIFGSSSARFAEALADLNRPRLRIGFWPIVSSSAAETAMGIATVLALLIEHWQEVRVYRLFVRIEGDSTDYSWSIDRSQFGVDDWSLEGLDENIAIWGLLDRGDDQWNLTLQIESDLAEDSEGVSILEYKADTIGKLLAALPGAAGDIADLIEAGDPKGVIPIYQPISENEEELRKFLAQLFQWELRLLLHLWGWSWDEAAMIGEVDDLVQRGQMLGGEFAAWSVSSAIARAILPMFEPIHGRLVPVVGEVIAAFADSTAPTVILATALFRLRQTEMAFQLLEQALETQTPRVELWLGVAELYRQGGYHTEVIDSYQRAIENDATNAELYTRYGEVLLALDSQGWGIETFILVDSGQRTTDLMALEAIEAFEAALELDPTDINALYRQVIQLTDVENGRLWPAFQRLVDVDDSGEQVRSVIDSLYHLDDISPAIQILEDSVYKNPERFDLFLNLGAAYLVAEKEKQAQAVLEKARQLTDDADVHAEIDRLLLAAGDRNFEGRLGEITDLVGAGSSPSIRDVDFLEATLEKAPKFGEAYLLLAKAYQIWKEPDAVLETLLDGQRNLPDDPDILVMLAQVLWESDEQELALDYVNRGLGVNPQHVPLLSLTGRYLFENGQEDAARIFLARAEAISPRHPALNAVRTHIARVRGQSE